MGTLSSTNKHLNSALKRKKAVRLTISTSSAIEGIRAPFKEITTSTRTSGKAAKASAAARVKSVRSAKSA